MWLTIVIILVVCLLISSSGAGGFFWYTKKLDTALDSLKEGMYETETTPKDGLYVTKTSVPGVISVGGIQSVAVFVRRWGKIMAEAYLPVNETEPVLNAPGGIKHISMGTVSIDGDTITVEYSATTSGPAGGKTIKYKFKGQSEGVTAQLPQTIKSAPYTKVFETILAKPPQ